MTQFESAYDEFTKRNAGILFIAAQKIDGLFRGKDHVQKHTYPFPILFDETRDVTRAYGVITLSVSTLTTSRGAQHSSSPARAIFVQSPSVRNSARDRGSKISSRLSNPAVNIEPDSESIRPLDGILRRCHRFLPAHDQLECMPESRFLDTNRQACIILSLSAKTVQARNVFTDDGRSRQEANAHSNPRDCVFLCSNP